MKTSTALPLSLLLWRRTLAAWRADRASSMGAALAYYTLFSLAPLLLIAMALGGLIFGREVASGELVVQLRGLMGEAGARAVQAMLEAAGEPADSLLAATIGAALMLLGAASVFGELQSALDRIWRVPHPAGAGTAWRLLRSRLMAFAMVVAIGLALLASLVLSAALAALATRVGAGSPVRVALWHGADLALGAVLATATFALIYKVVPSARIAWRDVLVGATVTAVLFSLGKLLVALYIGRAGIGSAFGAAGALAALLVWLHFSAQVFLLGAEFTWVFAHACGSRRSPAVAPAFAVATAWPAAAPKLAAGDGTGDEPVPAPTRRPRATAIAIGLLAAAALLAWAIERSGRRKARRTCRRANRRPV